MLGMSEVLEMGVIVGIDPESDGLARARSMGVATTHGREWKAWWTMPEFADIEIVFDATSAPVTSETHAALAAHSKKLIDLTPAALGPYVVPSVNLDAHLDADNVNMVTCGGQATIPMSGRSRRWRPVHYAEIVASIASQVCRPRNAGQHRRVHRDDVARHRADRRRTARQGDHRPESGRAAAHHA